MTGFLLFLVFAFTAFQTPVVERPKVEKIGAGVFRIGQLQVDTKKRELTAPATLNDVPIIEFLANTKGGLKAYESALTVESDAITFNAALILLGLDPARGKPSQFQFDPTPPRGDPVELHLEVDGKRIRAEHVLLDQRTKKTLPIGPWVYTGSTFYDNGGLGMMFLAEVDGVLIGLMHGPAAIIDNPRNDAVDGYTHFVINQSLGLRPGSKVTLIVTAIGK